MTGPLVVIDADELEQRIESVLRCVLSEHRPAEREWVGSKEAAAMLGVHPKTAARMARTGEIPARQLGRAWRFRRADLDAFIEKAAPRNAKATRRNSDRSRPNHSHGREKGSRTNEKVREEQQERNRN